MVLDARIREELSRWAQSFSLDNHLARETTARNEDWRDAWRASDDLGNMWAGSMDKCRLHLQPASSSADPLSRPVAWPEDWLESGIPANLGQEYFLIAQATRSGSCRLVLDASPTSRG